MSNGKSVDVYQRREGARAKNASANQRPDSGSCSVQQAKSWRVCSTRSVMRCHQNSELHLDCLAIPSTPYQPSLPDHNLRRQWNCPPIHRHDNPLHNLHTRCLCHRRSSHIAPACRCLGAIRPHASQSLAICNLRRIHAYICLACRPSFGKLVRPPSNSTSRHPVAQ